LLKLNANEAISSGATDTSSSGSVISRQIRNEDAPSIRADSISSAGIACNAPVQIRNMYGKPSQRFTSTTDSLASHGSVSHGIDAPPKKVWLTKPKSVFSIPDQSSADMNAGNAYGTMKNDR